MSDRQMVLPQSGGPEAPEPSTAEPRPESVPGPGPGELRLSVLVTSAVFTGVVIRKGLFPDVKEKPPFVPGCDLVGVADARGPGVEGWTVGERVADPRIPGAAIARGTVTEPGAPDAKEARLFTAGE